MICQLSRMFVLRTLLIIISMNCQVNFYQLNDNKSSSENLTELINPNSTNMTTTESPMTTTEQIDYDSAYMKYEQFDGFDCSCDLTKNWCDVDCCCDEDCSEGDKKSFGECIETHTTFYDPKYCYNNFIIYVNNAKVTVEKTANNLFCIVYDNVMQRSVYEDRKPITNLNDFFKNKPIHNYGWNIDYSKQNVMIVSQKFQSGHTINIIEKVNDLENHLTWQLPTSILFENHQCNSYDPVKYMHDFSSHCIRKVNHLQNDCKKNKYFNAKLYKSFYFQTNTSCKIFSGTTKNIKDDFDSNCTGITGEAIEPRFEQNICKNVVKNIRYTVFHNGAEGIIDVNVDFEYINLNVNIETFQQNFSVNFLWYNVSYENTEILSGNPGYHLSKPILAGALSNDLSSINKSEGYLVLQNTENGFCHSKRQYELIKFGINTRSGCLFMINNLNVHQGDICEQIQFEIWKILETNNHLDHIGVYGNSNISRVSTDWTPLLNDSHFGSQTIPSLTNDGKCSFLVVGVSINLLYANVGQVSQPQTKLFGAIKKYHIENDVIVKCNSMYCTDDNVIELSHSVSFYDLTHSSKPEYAMPPVIRLQLPDDFFYPFLTSKSQSLLSNDKLIYLLFVTLLSFYQYSP